ncbi:MAG: NAD(P)-binding domain-containing protein [Cyanobacteria bacterium P01_G01_bin.54]
MNIGIIGTGNMGRALGILWAEQGHRITFGARTISKAERAAALAGNNASATSNREAALASEVLLYTARGINPKDVVGDKAVLNGKILIDCNNSDVPRNFVYPPIEQSLAEMLQQQVPEARVVKSFNTMAMEIFEHCPNNIKQYQISNFVCGNSEVARTVVKQISDELGFDTIDCGELVRARLLEQQADFIRFLLISGTRSGAAFSTPKVPPIDDPRLGGRESTRLGELK